ncbi:MFS transporter [Yinghuangia aomiensis]|uniref:MFS transporter n=1 Tax=Yinghuangia aomiensis TaxID=676205 RepID=A0ABP9GUV4_9ACTN
MTVHRSRRTTAPTPSVSGPDTAGAALSPAEAKPRRGPGAAVHRWLWAFTASLVGDQVWFLALSWSAVQTGGSGAAGLVLTLGTLPRAALMLSGGAIADRFGARRIVIGSDFVRCAVMVAAAALVVSASPGIALLAAVALLFGAVDALFMPAVGALPATLTTRDQFARVQGLRSLAQRAAAIAGAPVGGFVLAQGGVGAAFATSGGLFLVSLVLLLQVRPLHPEIVARNTAPCRAASEAPETSAVEAEPPAEPSAEHQGVRAGLRYVRSVPVVRGIIAVCILAELGFSAPMNIGVVLLSDERGWGPGGLGTLVGTWGAGAVATGLVLSVRGHLPHAGRVALAAGAVGAGGLALIGYGPTLPLAALGAFVLGLGSGLWGGVYSAMLQTYTDTRMLGRVVSLQMLGAVGLVPLTYAPAGLLADAAGSAAVFGAGAAISGLAVLAGFLSAPVRRAELPRPETADAVTRQAT